MTIEELENNHPELILFKAYRGSKAYGLFEEGISDLDTHGLYIAPMEEYLLGTVIPIVKDEKGDNYYIEIGEFLKMVAKNNPTAMELLYSPWSCILINNPMLNGLFCKKNTFVSKLLEKSLVDYFRKQLQKASGEKKKINMERKKIQRQGVLDFCYTTYKQGSISITEWLAEKGLKQEYCGLVKVPNMRYTYNVFYDYNQHLQFEKPVYDSPEFWSCVNNLDESHPTPSWYNDLLTNFKNLKYKGIVQDVINSNDISLSSIPKGAEPICSIQFNKDDYSIKCKEYREYEHWKKNYNKNRFVKVEGSGDKEEMINSKNLVHSVRNVLMAEEIGTGKGFIIERKERDFLLSIKHGKLGLQQIKDFCEPILDKLPELFANSNLPEKPDTDWLFKQNLIYKKEFYNL